MTIALLVPSLETIQVNLCLLANSQDSKEAHCLILYGGADLSITETKIVVGSYAQLVGEDPIAFSTTATSLVSSALVAALQVKAPMLVTVPVKLIAMRGSRIVVRQFATASKVVRLTRMLCQLRCWVSEFLMWICLLRWWLVSGKLSTKVSELQPACKSGCTHKMALTILAPIFNFFCQTEHTT